MTTTGNDTGTETHGAPAPEAEGLDHPSLVAHVRAWAAYRLRETSLRDLAAEAGISKSAVDKFVGAGMEPEKNWPKLRYWFLVDRRARTGRLHTPSEMALLVHQALANVPAQKRDEAVARTLEHLAEVHRGAGAEQPAWLDALRGLDGREGMVRELGEPTAEPPPPARASGRGRRSAKP